MMNDIQYILQILLPQVDMHIQEKARDYGDSSHRELGLAGQFADIWRKIPKLRKEMWEKEPLTGEPLREVLLDFIGHALLSIAMIDAPKARQRAEKEQHHLNAIDLEGQRAMDYFVKHNFAPNGESLPPPCAGTPGGFPCRMLSGHPGPCRAAGQCSDCDHPHHGMGECISCEGANEPGPCSPRHQTFAEENMMPAELARDTMLPLGPPKAEVYRHWVDTNGIEHIAIYVPFPDGTSELRQYQRTTSG
jgi:hypothetical protein